MLKRYLFAIVRRLFFLFPDKLYLQIIYYLHFGKRLDLKNPQTFNEKLQWLKLYDRKPEYTTMVDKYLVKEYISNKIGNNYVIPTLAAYNSSAEISLEKLPKQFVLKLNNGGGGDVVICKDKSTITIDYIRKRLNKNCFSSIYNVYREWPYKNVNPKIICEQFMTDHGNDLVDYKVHNFNGIPKFILVCGNRYGEGGIVKQFYTTEWEKMNLSRCGVSSTALNIPRPEQLDEILDLSRKLSHNIPFLRTDFYIINGQVYFGELTFFPASGLSSFEPENWDNVFGSWLKLPDIEL